MTQQKTPLSTKDEIMRLISKGDNNLSAICEKLNLAPSTISKHLHDLEDSGLIRQTESHNRKWKHYELNPEIRPEHLNGGRATVRRGLFMYMVAITAIMVSVYLITNAYGSHVQSGNAYIPISITDPPVVPQGTQALYVNYSSLSILVDYMNSTKWVMVNSTGRLDLMTLINESQVIGLADIKPNSTAVAVSFNISSASIVINNVTYSVYVPQKKITAGFGSYEHVNASSSLLIDFSPTIATVYIQNSTVFILVPSVKAAALSDPELVGQVNSKGTTRRAFPLPTIISRIFVQQPVNLSAVPTMHLSGNSIIFNATINNNGQSNVTIIGMGIINRTYARDTGFTASSSLSNSVVPDGQLENAGMGINESFPTAGSQMIVQGISRSEYFPSPSAYTISIFGNIQNYGYNHQDNNSARYSKFYKQFNSSIVINSSELLSDIAANGQGQINITLQKSVNSIIISGFIPGPTKQIFTYGFHANPIGLRFVVNSTGSLSTPSESAGPTFFYSNIGYNIVYGSAATFSYAGKISNMTGISAANKNYTLIVITNMGMMQYNFTLT